MDGRNARRALESVTTTEYRTCAGTGRAQQPQCGLGGRGDGDRCPACRWAWRSAWRAMTITLPSAVWMTNRRTPRVNWRRPAPTSSTARSRRLFVVVNALPAPKGENQAPQPRRIDPGYGFMGVLVGVAVIAEWSQRPPGGRGRPALSSTSWQGSPSGGVVVPKPRFPGSCDSTIRATIRCLWGRCRKAPRTGNAHHSRPRRRGRVIASSEMCAACSSRNCHSA